MTTFQSVNVGLGFSDFPTEVITPTTPRAPIHTSVRPAPPTEDSTKPAPNTPTTLDFSGIHGQKPLPRTSESRPDLLPRGDSHRSIISTGSQDIDMDESDEGEDGSDAESIDGETGRPSKKKKGQRFFCTEYPPCKLSFTRSEHLARHIRCGLAHIDKD